VSDATERATPPMSDARRSRGGGRNLKPCSTTQHTVLPVPTYRVRLQPSQGPRFSDWMAILFGRHRRHVSAWSRVRSGLQPGIPRETDTYGKKIPPRSDDATGPVAHTVSRPGNQIESANLDFVGNHTHHALQWTASDHELRVVHSEGNPFCHAEVASGGSLVLTQGVPSQSATFTRAVTGGTGSFQGVTGTIVVVTVSPNSANSDVTITLHQR
jgi:hypothetical protein